MRTASQQADPFGWVGATIDGRYRIDEVVGEGGFGVVYRGYHLGFSEAVAIKCLKFSGAMSDPERERFQADFIEEGRILHRLSRASAGIVQALDVGADVSPTGVWTPYLALEWLRGVPLDRDIKDRRARGEAGRFPKQSPCSRRQQGPSTSHTSRASPTAMSSRQTCSSPRSAMCAP